MHTKYTMNIKQINNEIIYIIYINIKQIILYKKKKKKRASFQNQDMNIYNELKLYNAQEIKSLSYQIKDRETIFWSYKNVIILLRINISVSAILYIFYEKFWLSEHF